MWQRFQSLATMSRVVVSPAISRLQVSSLISASRLSSLPSNTLFSRVKPPSERKGSSSSAGWSTTSSCTICSLIRRNQARCGCVHVPRLSILRMALCTRSSKGSNGSPMAAWRMNPMIEAAMSSFFDCCQAVRNAVSVKPWLASSSCNSLNCTRVNSRGRCTTTESAVILFTLLRTKLVKLSRKSSGRHPGCDPG
jgi:hypothetical protein